jgi:pimeloyl-ACP methyl ester carboxylesterase
MVKVYKNDRAKAGIMKTYDRLLAEWQIPYEDVWIENDFGKTHVISCGKKDGAPLVLFHGVGDDSALMWLYNAKALGQEYHLYAIDTVGGPGKSIPGNGYDKSFDDVRWIDSVLNQLDLDKVHIIGTSHGGYLVMRYLVERPHRVMKAIVMASAVSDGDGRDSKKIMLRIFLPEALFPTAKNVRKLLMKLSGNNYRVFTEHADIMEHYVWLLKGFNNMAMRYHKINSFSTDELDIIRNKACLLLGEADPFEKLGGEAAVKKLNMNARFYPGVGHGINHEEAEEINKMILQILNGNIENIRNYKYSS